MTTESKQAAAGAKPGEKQPARKQLAATTVVAPGDAGGTLDDLYAHDELTALQAKDYAQRIAFGPSVFQTARTLVATGMLEALEAAKPNGLTLQELVERTGVPEYGARVLLESGLGIGVVLLRDGRYLPTKTAHFLLHDKLTRVNMDFTHEVSYLGLFDLEEAVRTGKPAGLKHFGQWPTVYEALAHLPESVRRAWFAFDQYYSDTAFPHVLPLVFKYRPQQLLDIGGNTGKWALACLRFDQNVHMTLADLPGQLAMARANLHREGFADRTTFVETNLLDADKQLPGQYDMIWMSQFLDCFSEEEIVGILNRCKRALKPGGRIVVLEAFWDRQRFATAAFCLQQTSLYFTAVANGNSQMYDSKVFLRCIDKAGLRIEEEVDGIGVSHTLLVCSV